MFFLKIFSLTFIFTKKKKKNSNMGKFLKFSSNRDKIYPIFLKFSPKFLPYFLEFPENCLPIFVEINRYGPREGSLSTLVNYARPRQ